MPGQFDPCHKWLAIPPEDQPPDHYRLLGLKQFESDPEVIDYAAEQRTRHVRAFQAGKHSEVSQRILNEIAAARVCLLNPDKKKACDESLRQRSGAAAGAAETQRVASPTCLWGTDNPQQIMLGFVDGRQKPGRGTVRFEPFEPKPITGVVCSLQLPRER